MKKALIVIAKEGYQDVEFVGTRKGLMEGEFEITIASTEAGPCHGKLGGVENADLALRDVNVNDYHTIAFIGGPGAKALRDDEEAKRIAADAVKAEKIVGAICIAPTILAAAGVLRAKNATVWNKDGEQEGFLREHGATYTGDAVTQDGKIVTGNGPEAAEEFGKALAAL